MNNDWDEVHKSVARSAANFYFASPGVFPLPSFLKENQTRILFTGELILSCYNKDIPKECEPKVHVSREIMSWVNAEAHRFRWEKVEWFNDSLTGLGCYLCIPIEISKTPISFLKSMQSHVTSNWSLIPIKINDESCPMALYDDNGKLIFIIDRSIFNKLMSPI